jgi:hypothetical protein
MSRRWISLLIVLGALLIVRAAVWLHRAERAVFPTLPKSSPPPAELSEAPPALRPEAGPRPAPAPRPARRAFDRLLAVLRSGDQAAIRDALEGVRVELTPAPVTDDDNAAILYRQAFARHVGETDDADVEILGRLSEGREITAEERAKLQGYLDLNRESLALLHEAALRPRCNFGLDYSQGSVMEMAHISPLILSARLLEVESALAGKDRGADIARASLRLSEAVADEPVMVSQMLRGVLHGIGAQANQKEFEGEMSAERLQALLPALSPDRIRAATENVLLFDLYAGVKFILDGGDVRMLQGLEGPLPPRPETPLTAPDLEYFAQTLSEIAPLAGRPYYEVREELERLRVLRIEGAPWYAELSRAMLPSMERVQHRQAATEACLGTAQVATALRIYRDAHGAYPATLDPVREILPQMPLDPFTGTPYLYRREGAGFVVSSAGNTGVDTENIEFRSPR